MPSANSPAAKQLRSDTSDVGQRARNRTRRDGDDGQRDGVVRQAPGRLPEPGVAGTDGPAVRGDGSAERDGAKAPALFADSSEPEREAFDQLTPYVVAPYKTLKLGDETLNPGDSVPGAENWPRLDAWLRARMIVQRA